MAVVVTRLISGQNPFLNMVAIPVQCTGMATECTQYSNFGLTMTDTTLTLYYYAC